jgi:metal-responsive CopG/Arc/MetJ family transcriptional regulator
MRVTVHIPSELLSQLDERAEAMKVTRNRYIVDALRKGLRDERGWSPTFLERLNRLAPIESVGELEGAIAAQRTRKRAPRL